MTNNSNLTYKKLGHFIQLVDIRNRKLEISKLVGVSIQKIIIPSIANTIGSNMKNYKIIEQNQFVYGPVTSRNGEKISIALFDENGKAILSQAYTVFEIINKQQLLPEYLMMWFRRPEFDRYARYKSHGSVREVFGWDEMCDVELPVPSPEKQQEIVDEYNTISNRIKLNEQMNNKLEETAQAIYKHWFVEIEDAETVLLGEYLETNPKLELKKGNLAKYIEMANLSEASMCIKDIAERDFTGGSKFQNGDTLLARITPCLENGKTAFVDVLDDGEVAAGSTEFIVMRAKDNVSPFWVYCLAKDEGFRNFAISSMIGSSGRQRVHESYLGSFKISKPELQTMNSYHKTCKPIFTCIKIKSKENKSLEKLLGLLLSKMVTVGE